MVLSTTIGLLLMSCNKGKDGNKEIDGPDDPRLLQPVPDQLKVYFDKSTVEFARYDSGFVVLQREGTVVQYLKRFVKENNFLKIDIDELAEGKYKAIMYLNVKLRNNNKEIWRQYRYEKDIQILRSGVVIKGPVNELKKDWKLYGVLADAARSIQITVPLDCADPYFEITMNNKQWDYIYLERVGYKKNADGSKTHLGAASFECMEGACVDNNGNRAEATTFRDWSETIGAKQWNSGEFFVMLVNEETGKDALFSHVFDIPDLQ